MSKSDPAIELSDIGVCYRLYKEKVYSLKEASIGALKLLSRVIAGADVEKNYRELWAVRHLNLKVARGQTLGLVGRNGSGKSTTLKVVSGVLHPTEGEVWVRGRVSALVELGAGFDFNLTGRENIYLGASVAGLSRKEIDMRMDRIVEFSELGDFIDIPVRNYSSGMYARLGFSLATDIDPDVLIIDEILSVGDSPFQAKCIDRMDAFKKQNKTILFVSHDGETTQEFCDTIVTLEDGQIVNEMSRTSGLGNAFTIVDPVR